MDQGKLFDNNELKKNLDAAIENACQWLKKRQAPEGFWMGVLESNSCMEAEWLLVLFFLGVTDNVKTEGLMKGILNKQRPDGSWEVYYDAPQGDINTTVEAYAALKAWGMKAEAAPLKKARKWILAHGGLSKIRVFTRYWLALIGEWPWDKTPNVPPEIIWFPLWFPFNIYNFACWARTTMVPLSILSARRAVRSLPAEARLNELFPEGRSAMDYNLPQKGGIVSWERVFLTIDRFLHTFQKRALTPGRETAIKVCLEWIIRHQEADGTWGGIQPPWVYSLVALSVEGYPVSHPMIHKSISAIDTHWSYRRDNALYIQACESPVWDTILALMAMEDAGYDYCQMPAMQQAANWLLKKQVMASGDWQIKLKDVEPGGWSFEHENLKYPDVDDTAVALIVLNRLSSAAKESSEFSVAIDRAVRWIIAMQCHNGGWGAFDINNDKRLITKIPFFDFGEALDPPSVDVTAHVIEALGNLGMTIDHPVVSRAVNFIHSEQELQGSWFGRWGVNHLYGTGAVLPALKAVGEDMSRRYIQKAADWIVSCQNPDGGWGETCGSYMANELRGKGESTASQSAWALMGLLAVSGRRYRQSIERGVGYLIKTQRQGTWNEPQYTGTGFPGYAVGERIDLANKRLSLKLQQGIELGKGFMINYNLYRHYFPLMALGRARRFLNHEQLKWSEVRDQR